MIVLCVTPTLIYLCLLWLSNWCHVISFGMIYEHPSIALPTLIYTCKSFSKQIQIPRLFAAQNDLSERQLRDDLGWPFWGERVDLL